MNWTKIFKTYLLPAIIILGAMWLIPPAVTPVVGPYLGTFTAVLVSLAAIVIAIWLSKQAEKQL